MINYHVELDYPNFFAACKGCMAFYFSLTKDEGRKKNYLLCTTDIAAIHKCTDSENIIPPLLEAAVF